MDSTNLKQYIKSLRAKDTLVALATGFVMVFALASLLLFWVWKRPVPISSPAPTPSSYPILSDLPSHVEYKEENGQKVPNGLPAIYKVQRGDSTWRIAMAFFGSGYNYRDIEMANNLQPDQQLEVGQELVIPKVPLKETAVVEPTPAATPTADTTLTPLPAPVSDHYVIVRGDSLWKIAEVQLGSGYRWVEIYRQNRDTIGRNPDLIYPGVYLVLPASK